VYQNKCRTDGTGPVYLTIGTAGNPLETTGFNSSETWSLSHTEAFGFARFQVNPGSFALQFILNENNSEFDEIKLHPWF
jgi:hypothetical protein